MVVGDCDHLVPPRRMDAAVCRAEVCYPFGRKHGRHRAVKRRDFIALMRRRGRSRHRAHEDVTRTTGRKRDEPALVSAVDGAGSAMLFSVAAAI